MIREREVQALPGLPALLVLLAGIGFCIYQIVETTGILSVTAWAIALTVAVLLLAGLFVVNPNEAKVLQFFGSYAGTVKHAGLRWANPLYTKRRISQRIRNFESAHLKVNDN